jgi:hypothetical protein
MKLLRATNNQFVFRLTRRERPLLLAVLGRFPCIPAAHHRLSRNAPSPDAAANQQLLDEALAEHRAEKVQQLRALLGDPGRFREVPTGAELTLSPGDLEWLLQVLNDVRVGSWVQLGSPEQTAEVVNEETAPHLWTMEMAGYFQMQLLRAQEGRK